MPELKIGISAVNKTDRAFNSVQTSIGKLKGSFSDLQLKIGALVGAAGMGLLTQNLLNVADKLGKTSSKLGISTKELQEFRFAAEKSGVNAMAFDVSLQRLTRRLAEAREGTGLAKKTLDEMGIALFKADGTAKSAAEILLNVADSMAVTEEQSTRVRHAFSLFDTEGVALVTMLQQGSQAILQYGADLRQMGGVINDHTIKAVEELNDRVSELSTVFTAQFSILAMSVIPQLEAFLGSVGGIGTVTAHVSKFISGFILGLQVVVELLRTIGERLTNNLPKALNVTWKTMVLWMKELLFSTDDVKSATDELAAAVAEYDQIVVEGEKNRKDRRAGISAAYEEAVANANAVLSSLKKENEAREKIGRDRLKLIEETQKAEREAALKHERISAAIATGQKKKIENALRMGKLEEDRNKRLIKEFNIIQKIGDEKSKDVTVGVKIPAATVLTDFFQNSGKEDARAARENIEFLRAVEQERREKALELTRLRREEADQLERARNIIDAIDQLTPGGLGVNAQNYATATSLIQSTIQTFDSFTAGLGEFWTSYSDSIYAAGGQSGARTQQVVAAWDKGATIQEKVANVGMDLVLSNAKVQAALGKVFDALFELIDPILDLLGPVIEELVDILVELKPIFKLLIPPLKVLTATISMFIAPFKSLANSIGKLSPIITALSHELGKLLSPLMALKDAIETLDIGKQIKDALGVGGGGGINLGSMLGFKEGGFMKPNSFGIVGEAGPELVKAGRAGATVFPAGDLGSRIVVNVFDGTGEKINNLESSIRVEINERANRYSEFSALALI